AGLNLPRACGVVKELDGVAISIDAREGRVGRRAPGRSWRMAGGFHLSLLPLGRAAKASLDGRASAPGRWRRPLRYLLNVAIVAATAALAGPRASHAAVPGAEEGKLNLAFVLLSEAKLPRGEAIERAFSTYA